MEDPLQMARIVLERNRGDMAASRKFVCRQLASCRSDELHAFWKAVEDIFWQAGAAPERILKKKIS